MIRDSLIAGLTQTPPWSDWGNRDTYQNEKTHSGHHPSRCPPVYGAAACEPGVREEIPTEPLTVRPVPVLQPIAFLGGGAGRDLGIYVSGGHALILGSGS
jgi:hypothetical protein